MKLIQPFWQYYRGPFLFPSITLVERCFLVGTWYLEFNLYVNFENLNSQELRVGAFKPPAKNSQVH